MRTPECQLARQRISLELDGELPRRELAPLYRHLERCPACATFAVEARRCAELLRATPFEEAPPFALRRRHAARRASVRVGAAVASAAAAALVAVSTLSVSVSSPAPTAVPFHFSPQGLPVIPSSDQTLGVQRPARAPRSAGSPRRGAAPTGLF